MAIGVASTAVSAANIGPSTAAEPYMKANPLLGDRVAVISVLTVGDTIGGYTMAGIPDGLGGINNGDGTFDLILNHEFGPEAGTVRAHGSTGSFLSRWKIRNTNLEVLSGRDAVASGTDVNTWDTDSQWFVSGTDAFNRFCSATLASPQAFIFENGETYGTADRIFLTGEETRPPFSDDHGRGFAYVATGPEAGKLYELPTLGKMAFENIAPHPHSRMRTLVIGLDDADRVTDPASTDAPSELYVYAGWKQTTGNVVARAGLLNGILRGVRVYQAGDAIPEESNEFGLGNAEMGFVRRAQFTLVDHGWVANKTGAELQAESIAGDVTRFQRIEDGAWDPRPGHENDFYFVTTGNFRGAGDASNLASRLWQLRFRDVDDPFRYGGTIELLLDGDEGHQMLDNLTVDIYGRIVMQEDVGGNARLGKIWLYGIETQELIEVAAHDPRYFSEGAAEFITTDEESSGITDMHDVLGAGWYMFDVQAHEDHPDAALVEYGQLLAIYIDPLLGTNFDFDWWDL